MKSYVFHQGQLIGEYDRPLQPFDKPEGSYIFYCGDWRVSRRGWSYSITVEEVPKEIRTLLLLMNIH